jgi:hypothetical protein
MALGLLTILGGRYLQSIEPIPSWVLHPPATVGLWTLLYLGLPGLLGYFYPDLLNDLGPLLDYDYLVLGLEMVLVGCACLWLGYVVGLWSVRPLRALNTGMLRSTEPALGWTLLLYVASISTRLLRVLTIGISYGAEKTSWGPLAAFDQALAYVDDFGHLVLAIVAFQVFRSKWPARVLIAVGVVELLFAFTSGFMKPLLLVTLILSLAVLATGRLSRSYVLILVPLAITLVLIVPVAENLRARVKTGEFNARAPAVVLSATWQSFQSTWGKGPDVALPIFTDKVFGRQAQLAHMPGIIMMRTPSLIPYQGMEQFLWVGAYIVPRSVWPDKPVLTTGVWFSVTYLDMPPDTDSSSALTVFGESYMFAGWTGVFVAMSILGYLLAVVFRNTFSVGLPALLIALSPVFVDVEHQFRQDVVAIVQKMVVFMLAYWVLIALSKPNVCVESPG